MTAPTRPFATRLAAAGATLALLAGAAAIQPARADDMAAVVKARQAHYKEIGRAMKGIGDELKSAAPSVIVIRQDAHTIASYAPQVQSWFPKGSGPEAGVKTSAKPDIWAKPDEFKRDALSFMDEANKFQAVAAGGDLAKIKIEAGALGQACKTCHQTFRARED